VSKYKAVQVAQAKGALELVERELQQPGPNQVRIKVQACGVCHGDAVAKDGHMPVQYPRVIGHEVVGVIDAVGQGVRAYQAGQRVGVGWFGGQCFNCVNCRKGDFINCSQAQIAGISYDGGYAESMLAPVSALALVPEEMKSAEAAPLLCAGVTTFNALRHSPAGPGDTVAVVGIGGLGHLAVQFAVKMGFRVVAVSRGKDKEALAKKLGAHVYIDTETQKVGEELQKLGGAKVVMATGTSGKAMTDTLAGLSARGQVIVIGAPHDPLQVSALQLIPGSKSITGWASGTSQDSQDTLHFSSLTGVKAQVETFPLEKATEAYDYMMSGKARFRVVLTTGL
jgi:D-arabinose 1-dehydrogenase-like Zn-dependent alcohol dehydrogenase